MGLAPSSGGRCRRWCRCLLAVALVESCSVDDDSSPGRELCERLRSHVIDVRLSGINDVDTNAHRSAFEAALGEGFVESCQKALTIRQVNCSLSSSDIDAVESCQRAGAAGSH